MQKVRFAMRRTMELGIIGFVIFICINAVADLLHKPIIKDRVSYHKPK